METKLASGRIRRFLHERTQQAALLGVILIVSILVQLRTGGSFLTACHCGRRY